MAFAISETFYKILLPFRSRTSEGPVRGPWIQSLIPDEFAHAPSSARRVWVDKLEKA